MLTYSSHAMHDTIPDDFDELLKQSVPMDEEQLDRIQKLVQNVELDINSQLDEESD